MKEARSIFLLLGLLLLLVLAAPRFLAFVQTQTPLFIPTGSGQTGGPSLTAAPTPTVTPTPTPRPLTLAEMNELYGPCAYVPSLMYHHVQDLEVAKAKNQLSLTVAPDTFRAHMDYIRMAGYTTIAPADLINFFDTGSPLPSKPLFLTFDDGYEDFGTNAGPILKEFGFRAIIFIPTGLMENPDYLSWNKISEINGWGTISVANHTWSHRNVAASEEVDQREIGTADTQLTERGLNASKVFSYPYGFSTPTGVRVLQNLGYTLAFTTTPGSILCKGQRLNLPRIRIGNAPLNNYGL